MPLTADTMTEVAKRLVDLSRLVHSVAVASQRATSSRPTSCSAGFLRAGGLWWPTFDVRGSAI